jgi:hypothetical protein
VLLLLLQTDVSSSYDVLSHAVMTDHDAVAATDTICGAACRLLLLLLLLLLHTTTTTDV